MRHAVIILATLALSLGASAASAQTLDANGKCRDATGQIAKMDLCRPTAAAKGKAKAAANSAHHMYLRDAQGLCHDESGKQAKQGSCKR